MATPHQEKQVDVRGNHGGLNETLIAAYLKVFLQIRPTISGTWAGPELIKPA